MIFRKLIPLIVALVSVSSLAPSQASAIVGGNIKEGDTSPYIALAYVTPGYPVDSGSTFCSGTLIGERWAVTAAHCFWNDTTDSLRANSHPVYVVVSAASGTRTPYLIAKVTPHPSYKKSAHNYDLAIVETHAPIVDASFLPYGESSDDELKASTFSATGWGRSSLSNEFERPVFVQSAPASISYLSEDVIVTKPHEGLGSICFGDSGGSLTVADTRFPESLLVGVISSMILDNWPARECSLQNRFISVNLGHFSRWVQDVSGVPPATTISLVAVSRNILETFGLGTVSEEVTGKSVRKTICKPVWRAARQAEFLASIVKAGSSGTLPTHPDFMPSANYPDAVIPVILGGEFTLNNIAWFSKDPLGPYGNREAVATKINARVCSGKITLDKGLALYRTYLSK